MSQHDLEVANQLAAAFRADVNNALQALGTLSSGATAPATTYARMLWADTTTNQLKRRNAANSGWIVVSSLDEAFILSRSSDTILAESDRGKTLIATGTYTQTLTAAATLGDGWFIDVIVDSGAVLTIDPNSTETIDGATTLAITGPAQGRIVCNGTLFRTIGFHRSGLTQIVAPTAFPAANTVTVATDIPQNYSSLLLVVSGCSFDTATRALRMRISSDNGSSWNTAGIHGSYINNATVSAAAGGASPIAPGTQTAAQVITTQVMITGYQAGAFTQFVCAGLDADSVSHASNTVYITDTNAVDALQLLLNSTGNFDAGTYALYGVK